MPHHRPTNDMTIPIRLAFTALLALAGTACDSARNPSGTQIEGAESNSPALSEPAPEIAAMSRTVAADTTYSDAPGCNALVTRIADEVLPCLQRVNPGMAGPLQSMIDTFRTSARLQPDVASRIEVIRQVEENCESHWRQVLHQFDSKAPEGQCLIDANH